MTAQRRTKKKPEKQALTFKCQFCQQTKPFAEMVVISRFFPPVVTCQSCEKKLL